MANLKEDYFYRGRAIIILVPYGYIVLVSIGENIHNS